MRLHLRTLAIAAILAQQGASAMAAVDTTAVNFDASQSLWGSGASLGFRVKNSHGIGPIGFSYDIGADTGTVSASFDGTFAVDHAARLEAPGLTPLSLGFLGTPDGGLLKSDLGAWVDVSAKALVEFPIIERHYALNVDETFTPTIGAGVTGRGATALGGAGIDVVVAKVGADVNVTQTDVFTPTALTGLLDYGLRGSGVTNTLPFAITSSAGLDLAVPLLQTGTWDFAVRDLSLDNTFAAGFGASLSLYERHINGIDWCSAWIFKYPCGFRYGENRFDLASIDLYHRPPFELAFNTIDTGPAFSIAVVPETGTLPMLMLGLAVLGALRMHTANRRRTTDG
jgi:hypothetical protein